jgi:2-oxoglutarate ferredoxin oxidoreductase subunit alpha
VPTVNDVVIKIGTVNGTGSASANGLLMKAIFRMGIPVVGKNYFPSNIQGLPTWYEIRVTGAGHRARADRVDLMIAMNAQTYVEDLAAVTPGSWIGKRSMCWASRFPECVMSTSIRRGREY